MGCCYFLENFKKLGVIVKEYDIFLCVDEVYCEFVYGDNEFFFVLFIDGLEEYVVVIDFVFKCYSVCGVRVGVLVICNCEVIDVIFCYVKLWFSFFGLG